jgi:hypothetical protein
MDRTELAIWITILSIVFAPAWGILANLITPKLLRWWSSTSLSRLQDRITRLEKRLTDASSTWHFTAAQWDLRDTFLTVALAIYAAVLFGLLLLWLNTVGLAATMVSEHVHASVVLARPDAYGFLVALFAGLIFVIATLAWFEWKVGFPPFRSIHSPAAVAKLETEIEMLGKKARELQSRAISAV